MKGGETLLLRGLTLERYEGNSPNPMRRRWEWEHRHGDEEGYSANRDEAIQLRQSPPAGADVWRQKVTLRPTGTNVLFALAGPFSISTRRQTRMDYSPISGTLRSSGALMEPLDYEVLSSNNLEPPPDAEFSIPANWLADPQILAFASRPEVCGSNAQGSLASQRSQFPNDVDPLDDEIASNIERYLRTNFTYTLDLTDAKQIEGAIRSWRFSTTSSAGTASILPAR